MTPTSSHEIFKALRGVIELPNNVISLELRLAHDTVAEITLVTHASLHGEQEPWNDKFPIVAPGTTKRYHLVEVTP